MNNAVVFDIEVYRNYFLAAFKSVETGKVLTFEKSAQHALDRPHLERVLRRYLTVGFNSRSYDLVIAWMAIMGHPCADLKSASDKIIVGGMRWWEIEREFDVRVPRLNHIDLIEVAPGDGSLKIYGGRLHAPRMQDLPIAPEAILTPDEMVALRNYCINDLDTTALLFKDLKPQLELRAAMGAEYDEDLRSKSDAQIAEAVIKSQVKKLTGSAPERPDIKAGTEFRYQPPPYIRFNDWRLKDLLEDIKASPFIVSNTGKIVEPPALEKARIKIGESVYRMGIGGLHSSEQTVAHVADDDTLLIDRDVASYYPRIILNLGLAPKHIGPNFLTVYQRIVDRRLKAKQAGNKVDAESLKITVNGSFGKLGSRWSALYAPDLMIQVTVTGQLALLMLIEMIEDAGIPVVSGNTDGVVIKCPVAREADLQAIVARWENLTHFQTEETRYSGLYSRDVNNYVAVKTNGETKTKGAYAPPGLQKNPTNQICVTAAIAHITKGTPVEETIRACRDVTQFVTVRAVRGGALWDVAYLGKAVRWYYSLNNNRYIEYVTNGNKVARTDGAMPLMDLPENFPDDVDYGWYIKEANEILRDIGFQYRPPTYKKRSLKALILAALHW